MPGPADRLEVGRVVKPHGLRGEVVVDAVSNRPERFAPGAVLDAGGREFVVVAARPHQGRWLVQFEGVDGRDAAERLRGAVLTGEPLPAVEGEVFVHEVIGATVRDRAGTAVGRVVAVEANPAHDLLVLDSGALVPMPFVVEVRSGEPGEPGEVVVELPEGLLDVNARPGRE